MAAIKYIKRTVSLDGGSVSDPSPNAFFDGEQGAHTFIIALMRGGEPLMLTNTDAVSGAFLNPNNATIALTGSIVNGAAVLTLSDDCYALTGRFTLTIDVNGATVYECQSRVRRRSSTTAYDPTGEISVAALAAEIAEMRAATAAASNVDIDMVTGTNEATITITRPNGTQKVQEIYGIGQEEYDSLKNELGEDTRNKWIFGDKEFTRSTSVSFSPPLPAGTYTFSAVVTSEASGTNCLVTFYNVGSTEILASGNITKSSGSERNAITVTLTSACESIILYSGGWSSGSVGYSATYHDIQLESGGVMSPYIPPITAVDRVARTECEYLQNAISEDVRNKIVPSEFISGKYIYYVNGTLSDLIDLSASSFISVEPNALYKLSNFTDYSGSDARGLAFYDRNKTFISGIQYHGESSLTGIVPNGAYYMRVTVSTNMLDNAILYCTEQKGTEASIAMFSKVGFCGDSYVAAQLWSASGLIGDRPDLSWGSVIGRLCGIEAKIYASSGADTNTWQTRQDCLPAVLSEQTPCGLYIFCMGINDATHVTLGNMSDITSHSSYTDYPNTFYGNYGKIIEQIQAYSSGSKIILMTPFHPDYNARYVTPLTEISEYYGIAMINTQESTLCNTNLTNAMIGGHPTSVQHSQMANNIIGLVADCILKYNDYFVAYYGIN